MPGFSLIVSKNQNCDNAVQIQKSQELLIYHTWYTKPEVFTWNNLSLAFTSPDDHISSGRAENGTGITVWTAGEVFNSPERNKKNNFASRLLSAYASGKQEEYLSGIDGEFCGVILDEPRSRLLLITDRYGLRQMYLYQGHNSILVCSELKGFTAFECFKPVINTDSLNCFMDLGHMVGSLTWFKNVELLPAASITHVDLQDPSISGRIRYWNWGMINTLNISLEAAVSELGKKIQDSVKSRLFPGEMVSIPLSGGLDSRAVLGSVPVQQCAGAFTFGKSGCSDLKIAQKAAELLGIKHTYFELTSSNWLNDRFHAVWKADAMCSIFDHHNTQFLPSIRELSPININGYLGDVIAGGSFLTKSRLEKRACAKIARELYGEHYGWSDPSDSFFDCPHTDPYVFDNRSRRMINSGVQESGTMVLQRRPFMSNMVIEFIYGLSDRLRWSGQLYERALVSAFGSLFSEIPWQKTGLPVLRKRSILGMFAAKMARIPVKLGIKEDPREFHDYPLWIMGKKPNQSLITLLDPKNALYPEYLGTDKTIISFLQGRSQNRASTIRLGRAVTFELWLQQIYNRNHQGP